jgi:glycosyltransferase involved in cell wall biosynthesis
VEELTQPPTVVQIGISFPPEIGGLETYLDSLCDFLRKTWHVYVLTYQPLVTKVRGEKLEKLPNLTVRRIRWIGRGLFLKLEPFPLFDLLYLLPGLLFGAVIHLSEVKRQTQLIHAHGLVSALVALLLHRLWGVPCLVSIHSIYQFPEMGPEARFTRWLLSRFPAVCTVSEASRRELIRFGVAPSSIRITRYWIDLVEFRPYNKEDCRRDLGLRDRFVVLFVGRLIDVKGPQILLSIAERMPDVAFLFIGDGPLAPLVQHAREELGNVQFLGRVENRGLARFYSAADVLAVPSNKHDEGLGRVIMEGLACGVPVVASRIGGIPEVVNEEVGLLVSPDQESFLSAIKAMKDGPESLSRMAMCCRRYAEQHFGVDNAGILAGIYAGLANRPSKVLQDV